MQSFFAAYIVDGEPQRVSVLLMKKSFKLGYKNAAGMHIVEEWMFDDVQAQYRLADRETSVTRTGKGKQFTVEGDTLYKSFEAAKKYNALPRYKKIFTPLLLKLSVAAFIFFGIIIAGYLFLAPWLSGVMAKNLPRKYEISLGEQVYSSMMRSYRVNDQKTKLANDFYRQLGFQSPYPVQVTVVESKQVNAFALPGGHIVIYSAIIDKMDDYSELAALLAHELTHINNRHGTQAVFRGLGSKAFLALLFGRTGVLTNMVLSNIENLKSLKYSRSLEKEADLDGLKLLREKQVDGRGFILLMQHLGESANDVLPEMLASHPDISKRIKYLQSSEDFQPQNAVINKNLPALFAQMKSGTGGGDW